MYSMQLVLDGKQTSRDDYNQSLSRLFCVSL